MSVAHRQTTIEFFGGPCDGHRQVLNGPVEALTFTTVIPMPFMADRYWLKPAWTFRTASEAVYSLDRGFSQYSYRYLGTIRRRSFKKRGYRRRLLCWLWGTFERCIRIFGKSKLAAWF